MTTPPDNPVPAADPGDTPETALQLALDQTSLAGAARK